MVFIFTYIISVTYSEYIKKKIDVHLLNAKKNQYEPMLHLFYRLRKQKPFMPHYRREPSKRPQYIGSLISCIGCLVVCLMFYAISAILQSFDGCQTQNILKTKPMSISNQSVTRVCF